MQMLTNRYHKIFCRSVHINVTCCEFILFLHVLLLGLSAHLLSADHSTREPNPCLSSPSSEACYKYISNKREVPLEMVRTFTAKARALYEADDALVSQQVTYMPSAVAVACLASPGTLRPGPDSDCAACGPACTHESRPEICQLYCTSSSYTVLVAISQEVRVFTIQTTSEKIHSNFWINIGVILILLIAIIAVCFFCIWLRCLYSKRQVPVPNFEQQSSQSENREMQMYYKNTNGNGYSGQRQEDVINTIYNVC